MTAGSAPPVAARPTCGACGAEVSPGDHFCEACGQPLADPAAAPGPAAPESAAPGPVVPGTAAPESAAPGPAAPGAAAPAPVRVRAGWVSSRRAAGTCSGCGGDQFGPEGYCDTCGQRRPAGPDHSELELGGVAGVSDRGHRHHHNEDAMALGRLAGAALAVVCDGVSSSTRPDTASHAAVDAAVPALLEALAAGSAPGPAIEAGARAAQAAATLVGGPHPGDNPPSCTFVCAVVSADGVTVGSVGDSRAYWLPGAPDGDATCLTSDDSLAGQLAAAGVEVPDVVRGSQASALTRWLGADARDTAPRLRTFAPDGPGRVLLCTDGLSRYTPTPADLAAVPAVRLPPRPAAAGLVTYALDQGGQDNVTAVLIPYPPPPQDTPIASPQETT